MSDTINSEQCGTCSSGGGTPLLPETDPKEGIVVRSKQGITKGNFIAKLLEGGKTVYELRDIDFIKPVVTFTNNAPIAEIGDSINVVTYTGLITVGTNPVVSRSISPDPGGLDLTEEFTFIVENVTKSTPGSAGLHSLQATDDIGNTTIVNSGVQFKHRIYQGFSTSATLNETQLKALVNTGLKDSILSDYAGIKTYNIPSTPAGLKYPYWCYPVGTTGIQGIIYNGLPFPIVNVGNITITNAFGVSVEYVIIRSANKFGTVSLDLDLS